jgi:hypothetical protein
MPRLKIPELYPLKVFWLSVRDALRKTFFLISILVMFLSNTICISVFYLVLAKRFMTKNRRFKFAAEAEIDNSLLGFLITGGFYFLPCFTFVLYNLPLFTLTSMFCHSLLCLFIICPLTSRVHTL